jgi:hypothetical protein
MINPLLFFFVLAVDSGRVLEKVLDHLLEIILVGIIVSLLLVLWNKTRFLTNRLFGTISVEGKWDTTIDRQNEKKESYKEHEKAELHQFLNRVWGRTRTKKKPERVYRVRGRIFGDKLHMRYEEVTAKGFDKGGIVLKIIMEQEEMRGYEVGIDQNSKQIAALKYKWIKKEEEEDNE